MMRASIHVVASIALVSLAPAVARAQRTTSPTPVEQTVADLSPLSNSLIALPAETRAVSRFDQVYRVPGRSDMLMRQSGALTAVFPYSEYVATEEGAIVPLVPPGTIFFIGPPAPGSIPGAIDRSEPRRDRSATPTLAQLATVQISGEVPTDPLAMPISASALALEQEGQVGLTHARSAAGGGSIVAISDEQYRERRIREISRALRSAD